MLSFLRYVKESATHADPDNGEQAMRCRVELDQDATQPSTQDNTRRLDKEVLKAKQLAASGDPSAGEFKEVADKLREVFSELSEEWIIGRVI